MVALASLLCACGSAQPGALNTTRVARAIARSIHAQRGVTAQVTCPTGIPIGAHRQFRCVAEVGTHNTPFLVTELDATGHVSYVGVSPLATPLLDTAKVALAIEQSNTTVRAVRSKVQCPTDIPLQRGLAFACIATTSAGVMTVFDVEQVDGRGHVSYHAR